LWACKRCGLLTDAVDATAVLRTGLDAQKAVKEPRGGDMGLQAFGMALAALAMRMRPDLPPIEALGAVRDYGLG